MKPRLLLYCQHSLGLGHFVRSLTLAEALAEHFVVTFFNGGPVPQGIELPDSTHFVHLPPMRMQEDGTIAGEGETEALLRQRRDMMLAEAGKDRPAVLVVELYPFGRKKFSGEIEPLIELVQASGGHVACSVRDVLVTARIDQARHDERAAKTLNQRFDRVLVHTDPALFKLEDSFRPATPLAIPVDHTGYVLREGQTTKHLSPAGPTLVAAGGGAVGHALYHAAVEAQKTLVEARGWGMTLVAGPLFPEPDWLALIEHAQGVKGLTLVRSVGSMAPLLAASGRFVGQCGYNSALEVCAVRLPALFVPFARGQESEQTCRAAKLHELGLAEWMPEADLTGAILAERLLGLRAPASRSGIDTGGARNSAEILREAVQCIA